MLKGANLGNWLVLEKWMSPELFANVHAEDETSLCETLDDVVKHERFRVHRDTYITDRDFAYLAARGIDFVRLPVPFFVFGGYEPFVGCIDYVDKAFHWAERHGVDILLDLHTVPDSQNGFDNGGLVGVCKFHKNPEHVGFALDVLEQLTARYRDRDNFWGIEVLNEPVSPELWELIDVPNRFKAADPQRAHGSEPVPTAFLKRFYQDAYAGIRSQSPDVKVVFHDGFRINEWVGFFQEPDFTNIAVDTHRYLANRFLLDGDADLDVIVSYIQREFEDSIREMAAHFPIIVGEWSLDPYSTHAYKLTGEARQAYYRQIAEAQLKAWEAAIGWAYWCYRVHTDVPRYDVWDMLKATESGLLPLDHA